MSDESFTFATTAIEAVVIAIGMIGSLLSIIVFSRKTFRNNSISTYCISLSFVEWLTLFELISDIFYLRYNVYLYNESFVFCKISYSVSIFLNSIQPWIMVAFSIDKLLSMRTRSIPILKKKWFQWSIIAGIVLFNLAFYIYIPILLKFSELLPGYFICDLSTIGFFQIYMILTILESFTIPFIILAISSILTVRKLFKSRVSVERSGNLTAERKSRDHKYAISSMILNVMFIIFKNPFLFFSHYWLFILIIIYTTLILLFYYTI